MIRPNLSPWRAPWKTDNFGYYNKPGWATKPPVPAKAKFREPWNWDDSWSDSRIISRPVRDDFFNRYPQGYAYSKYLRVSRRAPSVANASRNTIRQFREYRCYFCGRTGHIMRNCYRARRAGQA